MAEVYRERFRVTRGVSWLVVVALIAVALLVVILAVAR